LIVQLRYEPDWLPQCEVLISSRVEMRPADLWENVGPIMPKYRVNEWTGPTSE
jgi:hypothetical protein